MLSIEKVSAGYGGVQVLFEVGLSVRAGECVALLGPNGAGKTTLLRTVCGFLRPTSGRVDFLDAQIVGQAPHEIVARGISQVLQGRQVLGPMSVRDNLLLGGHVIFAREGARQVEASLREVYALFPILEERSAAQAGSLSGGEQQMLAIGRALMSRPRALLLDEPSMGLAPLIVGQIQRVLQRIKETGIAMLLVEQNPDLAFALAERCCVMESGHIVLVGATSELRGHGRIAELYLGGDNGASEPTRSET
jgi:branched-chain amino acid transport system ATP-binding protein